MQRSWIASRRRLILAVLVGALLGPRAISADPLTSWTPGPDAVLDNTYDGFIDAPAMNATVTPGGFVVSGWIVDKTADGWSGVDGVQIWLGTMDAGQGRLLAPASVGQSRPDVAAAEGNPFWAASGFAGFVPPEQLPVGPQTLSVYAHTPAKGWWYKQVNVTVAPPTPVIPSAAASKALPIIVIERPRENEVVPTNADYQIAGYALDLNARPDIPDFGIGLVQVYAGGQRDTGTFLGNADLGYDSPAAADLYGPRFATAGWRLTFHPTRFHTSTHLLFAYAVSAVNGRENLTQRYFNIRENP
jgi:hypothetical protein